MIIVFGLQTGQCVLIMDMKILRNLKMTRVEALVKYNEIDKRIGIRPFWEVRDIIENLCSQIEELQSRSCENCNLYFKCTINDSQTLDFCCNKWELK